MKYIVEYNSSINTNSYMIGLPSGEILHMEQIHINKLLNAGKCSWNSDIAEFVFNDTDKQDINNFFKLNNYTFENWLVDNKHKIMDNSISVMLDCSYYDLVDLKGIEKLKNLETLSCSNNKLTNLHGIEKLKYLTSIFCKNNKLTNLHEIKMLYNLEYIDCSNNNFSEGYKVYLKEYGKLYNIDIHV